MEYKICQNCNKYNWVNNKCRVYDEVTEPSDTCDKFK